MSFIGPSHVLRTPWLAPRARPVSTYEEDLLEFLRELGPNEMCHIQAYSTDRMRAGYPLSDYDIAMNDLLQQAIGLAIFDQDMALVQQITAGENTGVGQMLVQGQGAVPLPNVDKLIMHDCVVCQKPVHGPAIPVPCGHYYGIDCVTDLFQCATRDETLFPPRCCGQNIPLDQVQSHLPQDLVTTFQQKQVEFSTLQRVYCSSPTCSRFLGPLSEHIDLVYTCPSPECTTQTCAKCRSNYDGGHEHVCGPDLGIMQVLALGRAAGWVQCPGCSQMIERRQGCNHMTCRCRTNFCYVCSARWKTCGCPQYGAHRVHEPNQESWLPEVAAAAADLWFRRPPRPGAGHDIRIRHAGRRAGPNADAVPANRAQVGMARARRDVRPATQRTDPGRAPAAVLVTRTQCNVPAVRRVVRARSPTPAPPAPVRSRAPVRPVAVQVRRPQPTLARAPTPATSTARPTDAPSTPSGRGARHIGETARGPASGLFPATAPGSGSRARARARPAQALPTSTSPRTPSFGRPRTEPMRPRLVRWGC